MCVFVCKVLAGRRRSRVGWCESENEVIVSGSGGLLLECAVLGFLDCVRSRSATDVAEVAVYGGVGYVGIHLFSFLERRYWFVVIFQSLCSCSAGSIFRRVSCPGPLPSDPRNVAHSQVGYDEKVACRPWHKACQCSHAGSGQVLPLPDVA